MYQSLGTTLEQLQARLSREPGTVPVMTSEELSGNFHGLNISQVAKLVNAPALAYTDIVPLSQEGGAIRRFLLDGTDPTMKLNLARHMLIDEKFSASPGQIVEIIILENGVVQQTWVRDRNDLIYRVEENRAVVDTELTEALRLNRRSVAATLPNEELLGRIYGPIIIEDVVGLSELMRELFRHAETLGDLSKELVQNLQSMLETTIPPDAPAASEAGHFGQNSITQALSLARHAVAAADRTRRSTQLLAGLVEQSRMLHPLQRTGQAVEPQETITATTSPIKVAAWEPKASRTA